MTVHSILVSDKLTPDALAVLEHAGPDIRVDVRVGLAPEALRAIIGDYHGLAIRSATRVDAALLEAARALRIVGRAGIGVDNVDLAAAAARGVAVMNTPDGNVITTAEHAIALMFALARKIPAAHHALIGGRWDKTRFVGREITGKTLGIIGLGNIGRVVADRAQGLRMRVIAHDPFVPRSKGHHLGVEMVPLDALLEAADVVTLHVPLVDWTNNLLTRERLASMKRGALLVNAARGGLVDERAVRELVESGHLGGAAFDVFASEPIGVDHPLVGHENIVVTPHLGASTQEAQDNVGRELADQLVTFFRTGRVLNRVEAR